MSIILKLKIKRAKLTEKYFIFGFNDGSFIGFHNESLKLIAYKHNGEKWEPIRKADTTFDAHINAIISFLVEREALKKLTIYQTLLSRC